MANNKYIDQYKRDHYDRVLIWLPKGMKEKWTALAKAEGITLTEYIKRKVEG